MTTVTIHTAKTTLSQLVARADSGEEIILARGKTPIAKLVPYHCFERKRQLGALRGRLLGVPEFSDPLPEDELAARER